VGKHVKRASIQSVEREAAVARNALHDLSQTLEKELATDQGSLSDPQREKWEGA
jgi:hypothetical protein